MTEGDGNSPAVKKQRAPVNKMTSRTRFLPNRSLNKPRGNWNTILPIAKAGNISATASTDMPKRRAYTGKLPFSAVSKKPFIVSGCISLAAWLFVFVLRNEYPAQGPDETSGDNSAKRFYRALLFGWVAFLPAFGYGFLETALNGSFPVYALRLGISICLNAGRTRESFRSAPFLKNRTRKPGEKRPSRKEERGKTVLRCCPRMFHPDLAPGTRYVRQTQTARRQD